jgi:c-di-GMP-binding flagellar brake protein YcgR
VVFRTDEEQGSGTLHDISMTGARVEEASIQLKPGTRLRLEFAPRADCLPVEIGAEVVRETGNGFAVEFSALDPRLKRLLRSLIDKAEEAPTDPS